MDVIAMPRPVSELVANNSEPIAALEGVTKSYRGAVALHDTHLAVARGAFVSLLGPSGCGKTTALRLIRGFEKPDRGDVRLSGEIVTNLRPAQRPVNIVIGNDSLFPHMTVAENVAYGLRAKTGRAPRPELDTCVVESLALVDLVHKADCKPGQLTRADRLRTALARALIRKPKVLLLDEPFLAFDREMRETMRSELRRLHQMLGSAIVLATRDPSEALLLSHRVAVMQAGRIVQIGSPQAVYDLPASPFVSSFVGSTNRMDGTLISRVGDHVRVSFDNGAIFVGRAVYEHLSIGRRVTVCVRPDRLKVVANGGLAVRVIDHLFRGDRLRLETRSAVSPRPIVVDIPRSSSAAASIPALGERIRLVPTTTDDILVFPHEKDG